MHIGIGTYLHFLISKCEEYIIIKVSRYSGKKIKIKKQQQLEKKFQKSSCHICDHHTKRSRSQMSHNYGQLQLHMVIVIKTQSVSHNYKFSHNHRILCHILFFDYKLFIFLVTITRIINHKCSSLHSTTGIIQTLRHLTTTISPPPCDHIHYHYHHRYTLTTIANTTQHQRCHQHGHNLT